MPPLVALVDLLRRHDREDGSEEIRDGDLSVAVFQCQRFIVEQRGRLFRALHARRSEHVGGAAFVLGCIRGFVEELRHVGQDPVRFLGRDLALELRRELSLEGVVGRDLVVPDGVEQLPERFVGKDSLSAKAVDQAAVRCLAARGVVLDAHVAEIHDAAEAFDLYISLFLLVFSAEAAERPSDLRGFGEDGGGVVAAALTEGFYTHVDNSFCLCGRRGGWCVHENAAEEYQKKHQLVNKKANLSRGAEVVFGAGSWPAASRGSSRGRSRRS